MNTILCIDGPCKGINVVRETLPVVLDVHGWAYTRTQEINLARTCYRVLRDKDGNPVKSQPS